MERNVGSTDQIARILFGALAGIVSLAILASAVSLPTVLSPVLGIAALILLGTGFSGFCGLYKLVGLNTCPVDAR